MEILNTQLALFFKTDFTGAFENVSVKLKNKLGESNVTQLLPIPKDAPSEIPRLMLNYNKYNINVSKNRADIFTKDWASCYPAIKDIIETFIDEINIPVNRIGYIRTYFEDKSLDDLVQIIRSEKISQQRLKELKLMLNVPVELMHFKCNNIEGLEYVTVIKTNSNGVEESVNGIIVNRDINTVAEENYAFNNNNVYSLIDLMVACAAKNIIYNG